MSLFVIPACLALIAKLLVLLWAKNRFTLDQKWLGLVLILSFFNLSEVFIFVQSTSNVGQNWIVRSYYSSLITVIAYSIYFVLHNNVSKSIKLAFKFYSIFSLLIVGLILATPLVLVGYQPSSFAVTAIKGPLYFSFQVFCILGLGLMMTITVNTYRNTKVEELKIKSFYQILGLTPLFFAAMAVAISSWLGFPSSALVIMPIATTLFLLITFFGTSSFRFAFDHRLIIPGTPEQKFAQKFGYLYSQYARGELEHSSMIRELEKGLVLYQYHAHNQNASRTARFIGIPRSTFYSKLDKLGVDLDTLKDFD